MKLGVLYMDSRGKFIAEGFSRICDVIEINLSGKEPRKWQRYLSALTSFHWDRQLWQNDYYRNPLYVHYRRIAGNSLIREHASRVDAVVQFGLMTYYDYTLLGNPKVYLYHDGAYDPNNKYWASPRYGNWFKNMQREYFNNINKIFTFSKWAKKQHIEEYGISSQKVINVGWGPCISLNNNLVRLSNIATKFIFIGSDPWRKGLDILLKAFDIVQKLYNDITLDVIGVHKNQISSRCNKNVIFHGLCGPEIVMSILSSSDVFILPSRYERAGHATIEAMWYGKPVIVTDTCGLSEPIISSNCGFVIEPGNVDELVNTMINLIKDKILVRKMSKIAMIEARKNWTWDKVCERMMVDIEPS